MFIQRKWVTPLLTGSFILLAITGILMFFHLDSGANKLAHEWLSWLLVAAALLHVLANLPGFKLHLRSRTGQLLIGAGVLVLALSFLPIGEEGKGGKPPFAAPVQALAQAPLPVLAQVAGLSPAELQARLADAGVKTDNQTASLRAVLGPDLHRQLEVLAKVFGTAE